MRYLHVRTSGGIFGFVGALHADRRRPALLAVNGSFPNKDYLRDLPDIFRGVNVLVADLPGMGSPWTDTDVPRMTVGLGEAVERLIGDLPLVVFGASTGNLLALGLQLPNIVAKVSFEPFLSTDSLEPFFEFARGYMERLPNDVHAPAYLKAVFGFTTEHLERQDWRYLADAITVPTDVLVGSIPSTVRTENGWPSLVSEEDRAALRANPLVTLHEGPPNTGHDVAIHGIGKKLVERFIHQALLKASKLCV